MYKSAHTSGPWEIKKIYKIWTFPFGSNNNIKHCRIHFSVKAIESNTSTTISYKNRYFKFNIRNNTWSYDRSSSNPKGDLTNINVTEDNDKIDHSSINQNNEVYTLIYENIHDTCKPGPGQSCTVNSICSTNKCLGEYCCNANVDTNCAACNDSGDCLTCNTGFGLENGSCVQLEVYTPSLERLATNDSIGTNYLGNQNMTISGRICSDSSNDGKCRNTDDYYGGLWCYAPKINTYDNTWDVCAIPTVNCECRGDTVGWGDVTTCEGRDSRWCFLRGGAKYSGCPDKVVWQSQSYEDSCGNDHGSKAYIYCNDANSAMRDTVNMYYLYTGSDYQCPRGDNIVDSDECNAGINYLNNTKNYKFNSAEFSSSSDKCENSEWMPKGCYIDGGSYIFEKNWDVNPATHLYPLNWGAESNRTTSLGTPKFNNHKTGYLHHRYNGHDKKRYRLVCKGKCNNCDPSLPASNTNSCSHANNKYPNCTS